MSTPKRSVQPRQRGPIGRKCYAWRDRRVEYAEVIAQYRDVPDDMPVRPVLVLGRDPANVERIREQMREVIEQFGITTKGTFRFISHDPETMAEAISNSLNLTPAKRKGKK